jgi:hypothetical protein
MLTLQRLLKFLGHFSIDEFFPLLQTSNMTSQFTFASLIQDYFIPSSTLLVIEGK